MPARTVGSVEQLWSAAAVTDTSSTVTAATHDLGLYLGHDVIRDDGREGTEADACER